MNFLSQFLMGILLRLTARIFTGQDDFYSSLIKEVASEEDGALTPLSQAYGTLKRGMITDILQFIIILFVGLYHSYILWSLGNIIVASVLLAVTLFMCVFFVKYVIIKFIYTAHYLYLVLKAATVTKNELSASQQEDLLIEMFDEIGVLIKKHE